NVIVTQKDQTVTGDNGVFDTKANTVTMTGNVVMTQGKNVMQGETLTVDLTTGISRVENHNGRVQMLAFPSQSQQGTGGPPGTQPAAPNPAGKPMILNGMGSGPGR